MTIVDAFQRAISKDEWSQELKASWVADHIDQGLRIVDVRESHELNGPLGEIQEADNIPLLTFLGAVPTWPKEQPVALVCRSGRRSALAVEAALQAGLRTVASIEGGMLAWNHDVLGRTDVHTMERLANANNMADAIFHLNGMPEVSADWVHANIGRFKLVDVRAAMELRAGRIVQVENIPLMQFMTEAASWDRTTSIVLVCASGARSGRAARALSSAGFETVASMEGGMYGWRSAGLPIV